jgi:hypothetical protein
VRRLRDGSKGVWTAIEGGFIGGAIADVQAVVDRKEPKTDSYLLRCDEVWLLIVADGVHISSTLDLEIQPGSIMRSQFARVLFYDGDSNTVSRLK